MMITFDTVSTVEELRALPHKSVIMHPRVHLSAQVIEIHEHGSPTRRVWYIAEMDGALYSRPKDPNMMPAEEWLLQWLGAHMDPAAAFMVLYRAEPWVGYRDCNESCAAANREDQRS